MASSNRCRRLFSDSSIGVKGDWTNRIMPSLTLLRNGSSATLVFPYQRDSVLVVPQEATYEIQDKVFVYRVVDGKATSAQVTVFPVSDGREYIVESGLKAGDVIVAEGAGLLQEGTTVAVPHPEDKNASI